MINRAIILLILFSCKPSIEEKKSNRVNDFENIFAKEENIEYHNDNYENMLKSYQDSINIISKQIGNNIKLMKNEKDKKVFLALLKEDSIIFNRDLDMQTNMIYYSYNGYSEGINGEKSIYTKTYYLSKLKEHLHFLKGINYNLEKNIKSDILEK